MVQTADQNKKRYTILIVLVLILLAAIFVIERLGSANNKSVQLDQIGASQTAENKVMVDLTPEEQAYLDALGPVKICVDPDWIPYEEIDASGKYSGIAADLIDLIAERSGVTLELVPTDNWEASLDESQVGGCVVLSFLNDTPVREGWLIFTNTYFTDPSVLISREDHPFIANLSDLYGETMALPKGTSTEERIRREYPNIGIILVDSEVDAIKMVENRQADMTLRSMTMAAYTIKQEGFFNLKIVEDLPNYTNNFRLGVVNSQPMLRDILNKGIATLTPQEVQKIINQYVSITVESYDYELIAWIVLIFGVVILLSFLYIRQLGKLNKQLALRQSELEITSQYLREDILARKASEKALRTSEEQYRLLFENAVEAIVVIQDGKPQLCNQKTVELSGYSKEELLSLPLEKIIHPEDQQRLSENHFQYLRGDETKMASTFKMLRKDGDIRWLEMNSIIIDWQGKPATLNFFIDITKRKQAEEEILYLVYHDQLTGLYNRTYLKQLALNPQPDHPVCIFMFDIDRLKYVNDHYGHLAGDELITQVAGFLSACFREADTVVRIGGDEFLAIINDCEEAMAEQFVHCIKQSIVSYNEEILDDHRKIGLSVGYTITIDSELSMELLMQQADEQMYKDKSRISKSRFELK